MPTHGDFRFDDTITSGLLHRLLEHARALGAEHVEARLVSTRTRHVSTADGLLETAITEEAAGLAVRVLVDGVWGFAGSALVLAGDGRAVAEQAVNLARASAATATTRVTLAAEPAHLGHWSNEVATDPFSVDASTVADLLARREAGLLATPVVEHVNSDVTLVSERTVLATTDGSLVSQARTRGHVQVTVLGSNARLGTVDTVRTLAPPTARGLEVLESPDVWDWDAELEQLPEHLAEKLAAPSVTPGRADLVIDPSNLWLTIHESVGHATELDRVLGYEANYAGTSFLSVEQLGAFRYGSPLMNIRADRTTPFGLATCGWDDEAVEAQSWDLVRDGVHVGFQLDRAMATQIGQDRSNGCAYADAALHAPIQRMPNVSLMPSSAGDASTSDLIAGVEDGYYIVGDRSWSIDMQRYNFQFTGQRFYRIRSGRLAGQVRDLAYQARTPDFWGSLVALGDHSTVVLGGALNCGKGQPGQVAAVSHGCPTAVFEGVTILNTAEQA